MVCVVRTVGFPFCWAVPLMVIAMLGHVGWRVF